MPRLTPPPNKKKKKATKSSNTSRTTSKPILCKKALGELSDIFRNRSRDIHKQMMMDREQGFCNQDLLLEEQAIVDAIYKALDDHVYKSRLS